MTPGEDITSLLAGEVYGQRKYYGSVHLTSWFCRDRLRVLLF